MDNIAQLYKERDIRSKARITKAFHGEAGKHAPYLINNANYFTFGHPDSIIPDDYFTNPESMYKRQIQLFEDHYHMVEDDMVPYLMPFLGTGVLSSAFGSHVEYVGKMDPTTSGFILNSTDDVDNLKVPNMEKDGMAPEVLRFQKYFKEHSDLPVAITDCQGPLTTALQLAGYQNLFVWMYQYPEKVHKLMETITEAFINWVTIQKKVTGEAMDCCIGEQGIYMAEGLGVWLSDDDATMMPPDFYGKFVAPYNDQILGAFGGGVVHFCGTATQQIDNLNNMKNLRAVNNYALGRIEDMAKLRQGLNKDITLLACDYAPIDYEDYYKTLFEDLKFPTENVVINPGFLPLTGIKNGQYELMERDEREVVLGLKRVLAHYLGECC